MQVADVEQIEDLEHDDDVHDQRARRVETETACERIEEDGEGAGREEPETNNSRQTRYGDKSGVPGGAAAAA